ncbi:MAG: class I SAM-dependent methyltransferase [Maioricimonas sp. JB049]
MPSERPASDSRLATVAAEPAFDEALWQPQYPSRFFEILRIFGIGVRHQRIVDLGTGIGRLAIQFSRQGAHVIGVDGSADLIRKARHQSVACALDAAFQVAPPHETGLPAGRFDAAICGERAGDLNQRQLRDEIDRLLKTDGLIVDHALKWLPERDPVAAAVEDLLVRYHHEWSRAGSDGATPLLFDADRDEFELVASIVFDEPIPFTRESWRGHVRTREGIRNRVADEQLLALDAEHKSQLQSLTGETFTVLHRVSARLLRPLTAP